MDRNIINYITVIYCIVYCLIPTHFLYPTDKNYIRNNPATPFYQRLFYLDNKEINQLKEKVESAKQNCDPDLLLLKCKLLLFQQNVDSAFATLNIIQSNPTIRADIAYLLARIYALKYSVTLSTRAMYSVLNSDIPSSILDEIEADTRLLLTTAEKTDFDSTNNKQKYLRNFWLSHDPTPASEKNEFVSESFKRMDYVLRNFRCFDGLDDQGAIYLRYGEPDVRKKIWRFKKESECWIYKRIAPYSVLYDFVCSRAGRYVSDCFRQICSTWEMAGLDEQFYQDRMRLDPYYYKLHWDYTAYKNDLETAIAMDNAGSGDQIKVARGRLLRAHQQYRDRIFKQEEENPNTIIFLKAHLVKPVFDFARFWNEDKINVEIYFGFPYADLPLPENPDSLEPCYIKEKLVVKDNDYNRILTGENNILLKNLKNCIQDSLYYVAQKNILLNREDYYLALEMSNKKLRFLSTLQKSIVLNDFVSHRLFLSDIQISINMWQTDLEDTFAKNNLVFQPYPFDFVEKNKLFHIYFEIYNLTLHEGSTRYKYDCEVHYPPDEGLLEILFGTSDRDKSLVISNIVEGSKTDDFIHFELDCHNLKKGRTSITIAVKDLISGSIARREKEITLR